MRADEQLRVRDAGAGDASALVSLLAELGYEASPEDVVARLAALERGGDRALVAERGEAVVGLLTLHATPTLHRPTAVGRITALVVSERARGGGAGRALVEAAERALADRGCALVEVTSNKTRVDAHAFYERLGYTATSVRFYKAVEPAPPPPR